MCLIPPAAPDGSGGTAPRVAQRAPDDRAWDARVRWAVMLEDLMVPEVGVEIPSQLIELQCPATCLRPKVPTGHTPTGLRHACVIPPAQPDGERRACPCGDISHRRRRHLDFDSRMHDESFAIARCRAPKRFAAGAIELLVQSSPGPASSVTDCLVFRADAVRHGGCAG